MCLEGEQIHAYVLFCFVWSGLCLTECHVICAIGFDLQTTEGKNGSFLILKISLVILYFSYCQ